MSEYQYYEFAAVEGPISDEGLRYARRCSSRAEVSRVRWRNTYNFGDFSGSVNTLLKHYDAHFYFANWGTVCLGLAFPKDAISREMIKPYLRIGEPEEEILTVKEIGSRRVVWWEYNDEYGGEDIEGEGALDELIGIREELMRGDLRALFLGWLAGFYPEHWRDAKDGDVMMPPIPAGLNQLSPALEKFIEFFPVDPDVLAVASSLSQPSKPERVPMAEILQKLSPSEMRTYLARVADGGGVGVMADLNRLTYPQVQAPIGLAMSIVEFAEKVLEARGVRQRKAAAAAAAQRHRAAERRKQHLAAILQRADTIWTEIDSLMAQKVVSAYMQAASQLQELRDAYAQAGDIGAFEQRLAEFRVRYSKRPAMLRRIEKL